MIERQQYYKEMVAYMIEKYYQVQIDLTKDTEVPFPNVRVDMVFDIPKSALGKAKNMTFPYFAEVNVVHIKAVNDRLTKTDIIQYLGELYSVATSSRAKDKSVVLVIVSGDKVSKGILESLKTPVVATALPWILEIRAECPAYIFTLEGLPEDVQEAYLHAFQPLTDLGRLRDYLRNMLQQQPVSKEALLMFFWLRKLQPEFYREEIEMPRDMMEVIKELWPQDYQNVANDSVRNNIVKVLEARFGVIAPDIREKLSVVHSAETLELLLKYAATVKNVDDFKV